MEEALRSIYEDGLAVEADAKKHKLGFCDLFRDASSHQIKLEKKQSERKCSLKGEYMLELKEELQKEDRSSNSLGSA
eukprot:scaffold5723_cov176-Ochromonas_danica.AAC.4